MPDSDSPPHPSPTHIYTLPPLFAHTFPTIQDLTTFCNKPVRSLEAILAGLIRISRTGWTRTSKSQD